MSEKKSSHEESSDIEMTTESGLEPSESPAEAMEKAEGADESQPFSEGLGKSRTDVQGAHASEEPVEPRDNYQRYYSQPYDDAQAGPDAFASLEPMRTTSFQPIAPKKSGRGNHAKPEIPEHQRKSRRMRRVLRVVIVLLIVLFVALAFFAWRLVKASDSAVSQQVVQQGTQEIANSDSSDNAATDASSTTVRTTDVPVLVNVMGLTQEEAIASIGHGAVVSSSVAVNEEGNPVKTSVTAVLTEEPADALSGAPTVYLGLNVEGKVVQAGYSAATASLGYGTVSFADAVQTESIVEKTLAEAGLAVPVGTVVLPSDRSSYCTYASDGTTLVEERCSFSGEAEANGAKFVWESTLMYNYAAANASGNLADTIRQVYIYINAA